MMVDSASPDRSSSRTRRVGTARDVDGSLPQRTPAVQSGQEQQVFDDRAHLNQLRNAGPRARSPPRACSGWCLVNFGFPSQRAPRPSTACAPAAPLRPRYQTPISQHCPEWITTLRPPSISCYGSVTTAATRRVWCCRWPLGCRPQAHPGVSPAGGRSAVCSAGSRRGYPWSAVAHSAARSARAASVLDRCDFEVLVELHWLTGLPSALVMSASYAAPSA